MAMKNHPNSIHGLSDTTEYTVWKDMHRRCKNPKCPGYYRYGGRGIGVCSSWNRVENFIGDMGMRPSMLHTLDRIDNDGDYCPENCRWATVDEQKSNRSGKRVISYRGVKKNLFLWCRETGLKTTTLRSRLDRGWSVQKALTTPAIATRIYANKGEQK